MFGSQARPGMRGGLGSLSGSTLGDAPIPESSEPNTASPATPATTTQTAPVTKPPMSKNTKIALVAGGIFVWWKFFRKKK